MKASRTRFGLVCLSLVAFSVQMAVAVLHHHHDVDRGSGFAARAITAGLCAPASKRPCKPGPHRQGHDGCVLCWAAAIAANSLEPPPLPQIPLPQMAVGMRLDAPDTQMVRHLHRDHFQARGPPSIETA
jgi:hypothetical protein